MEHPSYEEGRLAAIAVRLAMSSGLPPSNAKAALELACRMIDDSLKQSAPARKETQKSEPCLSPPTPGRVGLGGGLNRDLSSSKRL
jgi:hypothetical protein